MFDHTTGKDGCTPVVDYLHCNISPCYTCVCVMCVMCVFHQQLLSLDQLRLPQSLRNLVKTLGYRQTQANNVLLPTEERQLNEEMYEDLADTLKTILRI